MNAQNNSALRKAVVATLIVALAIAALALTGCATKSASGSTAKVTTVKIGVAVPLTQGVVAFGQGAVRVTKLAVEEANNSEEAKNLGIKFEVFEGDDQGDPKVGVSVANQLVADQKVVGVVGHINSGVNIPASKIYNEARVVNVTPAATNPALTQQGYDNIFRTTTIDTVQGSFAGEAAFNELGAKTAFVVDDSSAYGEGLADYFSESFKSLGGTVAGREKTTDKDTDFTALATKIKAANVDAVYYGGLYNAGALFTKQLREAGVTAPLLGGDGLPDPEFIRLAGVEAAKNTYSTSIGLPLDELPAGQDFKAKFAAKYPGEEIAATDAYSYDAAVVIIQGVLKAASEVGAEKVTSPAGREATIKAVAATNIDSLTGHIAFDKFGDSLNKAVTLNVTSGDAWVPYKK